MRLAASVLGVLVVGGAIFLALHVRSDESRMLVQHLADLGTAVSHQDALEWRAIAGGRVTDEIKEAISSERERAKRIFELIQRKDLAGAEVVRSRFEAYCEAVDREIAALDAGEIDQAREIDESVVDPAYAQVFAAIREARVRVQDIAARAVLLSRLGAILTLLVAGVAIALIAWRAQGARQREWEADRERQVLSISHRRLELANATLEEASRLKSEFLANMSHELRTPLTSLLGFLDLMHQDPSLTVEEREEFVRRSRICGRSLLRLINDLLDMAKVEAGMLSLITEPVGLAGVFESLRGMFSTEAEQRGIQLSFDLPPDPVTVRADEQRLTQVMVNLVGNSIKFTPRGSVNVRAVPHPDEGHVRIEVVDTGIGVPKDRQRIVFDKFMQADGGTTRSFGGTGIGLSLARTFVEMMGGVIALDSEGEGLGTRVSFSVPIWVSPADVAAAPSDTVGGSGTGPLVLVVDDDPHFRRWVVRHLQTNGYRTVEAATADAAWPLVGRLRPDLLLLDCVLPWASNADLRSGFDLARRLASDPETHDVPFVFVTAFPQEVRDQLGSAANERPAELLGKPLEPVRLLAAVRGTLGDRPIDPPVRILLADDDPTLPRFVRHLLPSPQFAVDVVTDGRVCLERLKLDPEYHLVLLDLTMPEVSGYDVLRALAMTRSNPRPPVIVLSNSPDPANEEEARLLAEGAVCVLAKGELHQDPARVLRVVEGALWNRPQAMVKVEQRRAA